MKEGGARIFVMYFYDILVQVLSLMCSTAGCAVVSDSDALVES